MLFQHSIGIDIQENRISLVHLRTSFTGIQLAGYDMRTMDPSETVDQRLTKARQFVNAYISQRTTIGMADIFISVPNGMAIQRVVEMPIAIKENLREAVRYELEKYIPIPADAIYFDAQILFEDRGKNKLRVLLLVVKKDDLTPYINLGKDIGNGASGIEISATAMSNFFVSQSKNIKKQSFIFFLKDNGNYEFGFLRLGRLNYNRTIPAGSSPQDLMVSVAKEIHHFRSHLDITEDCFQIGTDSSDNDPTLFHALERDENITVSPLQLPLSGLPNHKLCAAFGLAIKGLKQSPMQINFMPLALRKKPSKRVYYIMYTLVGLIVITGMIWGASQVLHQKIMNQQIDDRLDSLKTEVKKVNELQNDVNTLEEQMDQLVQIQQEYVPTLDILKELTDIIPKTGNLHELSISGKTIRIAGTAESSSEIITLLETSPMFNNVAFQSAITKDKDGFEKFQIGLTVE